MKHWLFKSEPDEFSIDDLASQPRKTDHWDGVRNYQARNYMGDEMRVGDHAFFYHSNCKEPGIVGIVRSSREAYPDHTAFDPQDKHFDPKSDPDNPRWLLVDVAYQRKLHRPITLKELKEHPGLDEFRLTKRGNRLSIFPVSEDHWNLILSLE